MGKHVYPDDPMFSSTVSANECTGLQPTPPENDQQANSYRGMMDLKNGPQPKDNIPKAGKHRKKKRS